MSRGSLVVAGLVTSGSDLHCWARRGGWWTQAWTMSGTVEQNRLLAETIFSVRARYFDPDLPRLVDAPADASRSPR